MGGNCRVGTLRPEIYVGLKLILVYVENTSAADVAKR